MGTGSHSSKRKQKRSQKRVKKRNKSVREKTRKPRRRHDSVSCSSEDKSASTSSLSTSSLEDNYSSKRRARSRDRRKGSKKRIRRDSMMSDSSEDSPSPRIKRRKRSKKKGDFDSRKKRRVNKRRRESSSSSASDDSRRRLERKEDKWEIKERDEGEKGKDRVKSKLSRHRLRSLSPCSSRSESHSYGGEERLMEENLPKRLKSVIVVLREIDDDEVGKLNRDEHKDEIVYENDDYPSRSNDSNDGMSRGETFQSSHDASDEKTTNLEKPNRETRVIGISDVRTSEFSGTQLLGIEKTDGVGSSSVEFGVNENSNGNRGDVSTADASSTSVDLEVTLRMKALQNLLKRQGKLPMKVGNGSQGDHHSEANKRVGGFEPTQKVAQNDDIMHTSSISFVKGVVHPQNKKLETEHPIEKGNTTTTPVIRKPKLGLSTPTRRLLGPTNTWRRDQALQGSPGSNPTTSKENVNKDSAKTNESQSCDTEIAYAKVDRADGSELSPSRGRNKKDEINEADEDSEFDQKTMTVMRGGELVQVSYKVKIPKKAPALARRQLKR